MERRSIRRTHRTALLTAAALTLAFGSGGCANGVQGAGSGAILGGLAGMGLGSLTGDMGKGAAAGAIIGGVAGAVIGDQNRRSEYRPRRDRCW